MERVTRVEAALWFDVYGDLLTDHQRDVWQLYYLEDLSLAEIAQTQGVSRSAVHNLLTRTEHALWDYEERLSLVAGWQRRRVWLTRLLEALKDAPQGGEWHHRAWTAAHHLAEEEGLGDV